MTTIQKKKVMSGAIGVLLREDSKYAIALLQGYLARFPAFDEGDETKQSIKQNGDFLFNGVKLFVLSNSLDEEEANRWFELPLGLWWDRYMYPSHYANKITPIGFLAKRRLKASDVLYHQGRWWKIVNLSAVQERLNRASSENEVMNAIVVLEQAGMLFRPDQYRGCTSIVGVPPGTNTDALRMHLAMVYPGLEFTIQQDPNGLIDIYCLEAFVPNDSKAGNAYVVEPSGERRNIGPESLCASIDDTVRKFVEGWSLA